ncbi:hypothetical protein CC1G_14497 [Coprinopsis cinerea okayama7|uniref:Uncharacterized protein n=1 Tax=Coprinopsis cinerea (strain Okayama-7 / 130 / ATCC MYA-4618 / FGSC 9003) TaxID=240176 RepID=D6RLV7_COPC7|nr:hypothetical protein CC1G_14497 [Coprinopsis cinerea okayama7\|eukprot:XP_002911499.1 hypothetical protein CC1G_14497 [Coprinopsis cinerea okayama7\
MTPGSTTIQAESERKGAKEVSNGIPQKSPRFQRTQEGPAPHMPKSVVYVVCTPIQPYGAAIHERPTREPQGNVWSRHQSIMQIPDALTGIQGLQRKPKVQPKPERA